MQASQYATPQPPDLIKSARARNPRRVFASRVTAFPLCFTGRKTAARSPLRYVSCKNFRIYRENGSGTMAGAFIE